MRLFENLRQKFNYTVIKPLLYTAELTNAYQGVSVCNGALKNKVVVVTGATGGIGIAIVRRFLNEGSHVIMVGRNEDRLKAFQKEIESEAGGLTYVIVDMLDYGDVKAKTIDILQHHKVDIWVNCAGVLKKNDRNPVFRSYAHQDFLDVMNTNLKSCYLICTLIAEQMRKISCRCKIMNITSICGFSKTHGYTGFGMSKAGMIELSKIMAEAYKDCVDIVSIAPGSIATAMGEKQMGDNIAVGSNMITRHIGMPEEIAALTAFMTSHIDIFGKTIVASADERL